MSSLAYLPLVAMIVDCQFIKPLMPDFNARRSDKVYCHNNLILKSRDISSTASPRY